MASPRNTSILFAILSACGLAGEPMPSVSVEDLNAKMAAEKGIVLLDVRTPQEFASGHVPGAQSIPLSSLSTRIDELSVDQATPVYLICQSGGRSARATNILRKKGYTAINVSGGTSAWNASGFPIDR